MDIARERSYPTPLANSPLLPMLLLSLMRQKNAPKTAKVIYSEYDYVIVGAGSAGSVVASRLSEMPCVRVLLLEAGKAPPYLTEVPGIATSFWNTDLDWTYRTVPLRYTGRLMVNRQAIWRSGNMLGGTSNLNFMLFLRGHRKDYDDWAAAGAEGWSYKDVFPYFLKMEDNRDPEYVSNGYHGVGGPLSVQRPWYQSKIKDSILKAAQGVGYRLVDLNGPRQTGMYDIQSTMRAGQRCGTAKAYLVPAENRTNLDILPNARVRKVVIRNRRAVGVEFDFQLKTYVVKARREVVMSAGTINTPHLLMLSGIGPKKELRRHKIPVVADLPVGQNLQNHCGQSVNFVLSPTFESFREQLKNPRNVEQYIQRRTGPFASSQSMVADAWGNANPIKQANGFPNFDLAFAEGLSLQESIIPEVLEQMYGPYEGKPGFTCFAGLQQPRSRGTVTLNSTDPYDPPILDPNYFEDPEDLEDIVNGLKMCNRIGSSPELRSLGSVPFRTMYPGCEQFIGDEDEYWRCALKAVVLAYFHQVGTARMGNPKDPRTVVDPQLRVKHIKGLRVVDASVMPIIPRGATNAPTIMVAEKASDIIKDTIQCNGYGTDGDWWPAHEYSNIHEKSIIDDCET